MPNDPTHPPTSVPVVDLSVIRERAAQKAAMEAGAVPPPRNWDTMSWAERAEIHAINSAQQLIQVSGMVNDIVIMLQNGGQPAPKDMTAMNLIALLSQMNANLGRLCEAINERQPTGNVTVVPETGRISATDPNGLSS